MALSLVYSTFLGGAGRELGQGIAVDINGNAYVTGITESFDSPFTSAYEGFPVTPGAFQTKGSYDAFVSKLNAKGSALMYSTYLGGSAGVDRGWAIALDDAETLTLRAIPPRATSRSAMQSRPHTAADRLMLLSQN